MLTMRSAFCNPEPRQLPSKRQKHYHGNMMNIGFLFALGALLGWAFGDFYLHRTAKHIGIWKAMLYVSGLGSFVLLPFVITDIGTLVSNPNLLLILSLTAVIVFVALLLSFEALKDGKMAVVEPIIGAELPMTVGLSLFFLHDKLSIVQLALILAICIGLILSVMTHLPWKWDRRKLFERGVITAAASAIGMALVNFFIGVSSQETKPLLTIWFINTVVAMFALAYLLLTGERRHLFVHAHRYRKEILLESFHDNFAWVCFAYAVTLLPISLVTAVSEGYIALAALLGIITAVVTAPVLVFAAMDASATGTSAVAPGAGSGAGGNAYQPIGGSGAASILAVTTEEEAGGGAEEIYANGIPECLTDCRIRMVVCSRNAITAAAPGSVEIVNLTACQSKYDRCSRDCRPVPPPAVDCDTRCAVRVGACIRAAGHNETQFNQCRADNLACLTVCGRGRLTLAGGEQESVLTCRTQATTCVNGCKTFPIKILKTLIHTQGQGAVEQTGQAEQFQNIGQTSQYIPQTGGAAQGIQYQP